MTDRYIYRYKLATVSLMGLEVVPRLSTFGGAGGGNGAGSEDKGPNRMAISFKNIVWYYISKIKIIVKS